MYSDVSRVYLKVEYIYRIHAVCKCTEYISRECIPMYPERIPVGVMEYTQNTLEYIRIPQDR